MKAVSLTQRMLVSRMTLFASLGLGLASSALAQPAGLDFVTIGAPGNRATIDDEVPNTPGLRVGAVAYEYRITRTEVLSEQWLDFMRAYAPYWGAPVGSDLTGRFIDYDPVTREFSQNPVSARNPVRVQFQTAARFCNWLHNDRRSDRGAFESGAYDMSTFTDNPDGSRNDQLTHSPGARYWIPTLDETMKAFYFDPNRYGPGQEGYWRGPQSSDAIPISGPPGTGTTNAGISSFPGAGIAAGQYPQHATPWGLLDASGGESEMTDTVVAPFVRARARVGTSYSTSREFIQFYDRIDGLQGDVAREQIGGFRLATAVPVPSTSLPILSALVWSLGKRKRSLYAILVS